MLRTLIVLAGTAALGLATQASANVTVTVWASGVSADTLAAMATAIDHAHPDLTVRAVHFPPGEYERALASAASSRLMPDILAVAPGAETQSVRGSLVALDPIADQALGKEWKDHFPKKLLDEARLGNPPGDDSLYMLPMTTGIDGIWMSNPAAARAHAPASVPKTLAELAAKAERMRSAGMEPLVLGGASDRALVRFFLQVATETDPSAVRKAEHGAVAWTDPGMQKAAAVWRQLFAQQIVPRDVLGKSPDQARHDFLHGKAGMIVEDAGALAGAGSVPESQFFTFPAVPPSHAPAPLTGGVALGWAMTRVATGQNSVKVASAEVLHDLIAGPAAQVAIDRWQGFPAWERLAPQQPPPAPVAAIDRWLGTQVSKAKPDVVAHPATERVLAEQLRLLAEAKISPQAAMRTVNATAKREQELAG